jgi:hypothetical protein
VREAAKCFWGLRVNGDAFGVKERGQARLPDHETFRVEWLTRSLPLPVLNLCWARYALTPGYFIERLWRSERGQARLPDDKIFKVEWLTRSLPLPVLILCWARCALTLG